MASNNVKRNKYFVLERWFSKVRMSLLTYIHILSFIIERWTGKCMPVCKSCVVEQGQRDKMNPGIHWSDSLVTIWEDSVKVTVSKSVVKSFGFHMLKYSLVQPHRDVCTQYTRTNIHTELQKIISLKLKYLVHDAMVDRNISLSWYDEVGKGMKKDENKLTQNNLQELNRLKKLK